MESNGLWIGIVLSFGYILYGYLYFILPSIFNYHFETMEIQL